MDEAKLQSNIQAFREFVHSKGWTDVSEKEIAYGYQLVVTDGITKIPIDFFSSGKALIQGKPSALQNEVYNKIHNLNVLLARAHAHALESLLEKVSCDLAIADQFGNKSILLNALMEKGRKIKLEQRPHAEEDIAVAAASILARAKFVQ